MVLTYILASAPSLSSGSDVTGVLIGNKDLDAGKENA